MNNEKTILVIEDEKGIRNFIHNALTTNGCKTILAENGKNARTAFLSQCPEHSAAGQGRKEAPGCICSNEKANPIPLNRNQHRLRHPVAAEAGQGLRGVLQTHQPPLGL